MRFKIRNHIIFENENYIAVNKPAGISSLHERLGRNLSVVEAVKAYDEDAQLCHRLDKYTSGLLLISKNAEAYRNAAIQFEKRKVGKVYHAVSCGIHDFKDLTIDLPLTTTRSGRASVNKAKGKESKTRVNSIENFGKFTLVECTPLTGRLHQIRIHLASLGASIAMDEVYGGCVPYLSAIKPKFNLSKGSEEIPIIGRFALHAYGLNIKDVNGDKLDITAEYPKDFAVFLKILRKYNKNLH